MHLSRRILKYIHHPFQVDREPLTGPQGLLQLLCMYDLHDRRETINTGPACFATLLCSAAAENNNLPLGGPPYVGVFGLGKRRTGYHARLVCQLSLIYLPLFK